MANLEHRTNARHNKKVERIYRELSEGLDKLERIPEDDIRAIMKIAGVVRNVFIREIINSSKEYTGALIASLKTNKAVYNEVGKHLEIYDILRPDVKAYVWGKVFTILYRNLRS